jgi:hypothetical protein
MGKDVLHYTNGVPITQISLKVYQNSYENLDYLVISKKYEGIKPLGLVWHPSQDTFKYEINIKLGWKIVTKRVVLYLISSHPFLILQDSWHQ